MADSVTAQVRGLPELKQALGELPRTLRRKVLMKALRAAAKVVLVAARQSAPVLKDSLPNEYRKRGTLRRRLTIRTSKVARSQGNVGVFVNVKPLRPGGTQNPNDPYYWRFVEFGTKAHFIKPKNRRALAIGLTGAYKQVRHPGARATPFLRPAAAKLDEAYAVFEREIIPAIEALNR